MAKKPYDPFINDYWDEKTDHIEEDAKITSKRTFGVELEMLGRNLDEMGNEAISNGHHFSNDGSIKVKGDDRGIEVQTGILSGEKGAKSLTHIMGRAIDLGFVTNGTCGTHVHFGGDDLYDKNNFTLGGLADIKIGNTNILFERKLMSLMTKAMGGFNMALNNVIGDISYQLGRPYTNEYCMDTGKYSRYCVVPVQYFDQTYFMVIRESTLAKMGASQRYIWENGGFAIEETSGGRFSINAKDVVVVWKPDSQKYKKLKKLFFFYTVFNTVLYSMLPKERRKSVYARNLAGSYSLKDIQKCQSQGELEKLWYQKETFAEVERDKNRTLSAGDHSTVRYHAINFHSLYYRHGTVEVRMHHGTLNAKSMLHWIKLHQAIIDGVVEGKINDTCLIACAKGYDTPMEGGELLIDALGVRGTSMETFIKHRIKKYN